MDYLLTGSIALTIEIAHWRMKMPKYRIIVQETKSYFIEADNEELARDNVNSDLETLVQSCTLDRFEIQEIEDE